MSQGRDTLVDALAARAPRRAVEVGVGFRPDVAAALADRGRTVVATDIVDQCVPDGVRFVRDDLLDPTAAVYRDADLIYALNCPPELQRPLRDRAAAANAGWAFTTLGGDPTVVAANPRTLPKGTLFTPPSWNDSIG